MGISCKPMGKMRGHFTKLDNAIANERAKAVNANKKSTGKKRSKEA